MPQPLFELLKRSTVKVIVPNDWGTGFFVAPGQVLTCAHVVRQHPGESIELHQQGTKIATVRQIHRPQESDLDVVLLEVVSIEGAETNDFPCVALGDTYNTDDELYLYGFPSDFKPGAPTAGGVCEGETADERGPLIKFRGMQIQPGHSGSALLNRKTGQVCGVVNKTRGAATDLGGVAVPVGEIWRQFPELRQRNQDFHQQDQRWRETVTRHMLEVHDEPSPQQKTMPSEQITNVPMADPNVSLNTKERLALSRNLNGLTVQEFNEVLFLLDPPKGLIPPPSASQGDRVFALLSWAQSTTGRGLGEVKTALDDILRP
ncbi:MAG: serine protease [Elainellaceae cyanobacterium]